MASTHRYAIRSKGMSFEICPGYMARQLDVAGDYFALLTLGRRCEDYITLALGRKLPSGEIPGALARMLKPKTVPAERSFVFGLYPECRENGVASDDLQGILYFLHPPPQTGTWFLTRCCLRLPCGAGAWDRHFTGRSRVGRNPGGANRLVVAVAENNPRARNFWHHRIGYTPLVRAHGVNPEFELRLGPEPPCGIRD